jgi:NADPH2:quinone reductase
MKAIVVREFGDPNVMSIEDVPDPEAKSGQIVVAIRAAGPNPYETYQRAGKYGVLPKLPYTPGSDSAGVVERVGEGVTDFKIGDRVYSNASLSGTYAEKAIFEAKSLHRLPEKISFEQGAALGAPYATAYYALALRAHAKKGESVLIHGASGAVGLAAVQFAHAMGLTVIGTASTEDGRKVVKENGADHVLDHKREGYLDELKPLTTDKGLVNHEARAPEGRTGVDLILEMLANVNLAKDLGVIAKRGRIIVIGNRGKVEIDPRDAMSKEADIRGMSIMNASDEQLHSIHEAIIAGLEAGSLRPVIAKKFPLAEAPAAHRELEQSHEPGKIVLIP